jgi:hypothetical protein
MQVRGHLVNCLVLLGGDRPSQIIHSNVRARTHVATYDATEISVAVGHLRYSFITNYTITQLLSDTSIGLSNSPVGFDLATGVISNALDHAQARDCIVYDCILRVLISIDAGGSQSISKPGQSSHHLETREQPGFTDLFHRAEWCLMDPPARLISVSGRNASQTPTTILAYSEH